MGEKASVFPPLKAALGPPRSSPSWRKYQHVYVGIRAVENMEHLCSVGFMAPISFWKEFRVKLPNVMPLSASILSTEMVSSGLWTMCQTHSIIARLPSRGPGKGWLPFRKENWLTVNETVVSAQETDSKTWERTFKIQNRSWWTLISLQSGRDDLLEELRKRSSQGREGDLTTLQ